MRDLEHFRPLAQYPDAYAIMPELDVLRADAVLDALGELERDPEVGYELRPASVTPRPRTRFGERKPPVFTVTSGWPRRAI